MLFLVFSWNYYKHTRTVAPDWDAPGVLPDAPGALPERSWTHPGPPRRCILSPFWPKRLVGTPHIGKIVVTFAIV